MNLRQSSDRGADNAQGYSDEQGEVTPEASEGEGIRFRKVTPEMDAEYMSAVENGDMETAERLVKEAAKMAMLDKWEAGVLSKLTGSTAEGVQRQMEIIQPLIDYINNGRQGTQSSVGEVVRDRGMYNNTANQKKTAETEGTGATATGGLTEGVRTLFSKKELTPKA